jgi:hypothetical protein
MLLCCISYGATVIDHSTGTTTYTTPKSIKSGDNANVSGGDATFQNTFKAGSSLTLSGGSATIDGSFSGDISATGGTLLLGSNQSVKGSTTITMGNTTMITNGEDFNISSLTLTANSTVDLSGTTDNNISFGTLVDSNFTLDFLNWQSTDTISFDAPLPTNTVVTLNGQTAQFLLQGQQYVIIGTGIPETSTYITVGLILGLVVFHWFRKSS